MLFAEESLGWPQVVLILGILLANAVVMWVMFRKGKDEK